MSKNKICVACGFEDFEDNINNFCCNCGKDIDTGLTLEEMDKQGINYLIDKRTNEYRNSIIKHNDLDCLDCKQKDQRIAELEKELEKTKCLYNDSIDRETFLTDEERRTYYKNVELKKENDELKIENNEFCDYNKKLREEKQTTVKEFADEILNMWGNYSAKEESDIFSFYYHFEDNILELLKERGIE